MAMPFPLDIFGQALEGNWVAYFAIGMTIAVFALGVFVIILWRKMPQLAKNMFVNETFGGHHPTVAQCLETRRIIFHNPTMLRNGFAYDKQRKAVYLPPKLWTETAKLTEKERNIVENVYSIDGSQSPFFLNYSVQAYMTNPEVLALIQNDEWMKKFASKGLNVKTDVFYNAMKEAKVESLNFKGLNFSFPIDVKHLKTALNESISDSDFIEFENEIRQDERGNRSMLSSGMLLGILTVVLVVVDIALQFLK